MLFNILGVIAFVAGVLLLIIPDLLKKIAKYLNSMIALDDQIYKLRQGIGASLLLCAGFFFFIAYYMAKKHYL